MELAFLDFDPVMRMLHRQGAQQYVGLQERAEIGVRLLTSQNRILPPCYVEEKIDLELGNGTITHQPLQLCGRS